MTRRPVYTPYVVAGSLRAFCRTLQRGDTDAISSYGHIAILAAEGTASAGCSAQVRAQRDDRVYAPYALHRVGDWVSCGLSEVSNHAEGHAVRYGEASAARNGTVPLQTEDNPLLAAE